MSPLRGSGSSTLARAGPVLISWRADKDTVADDGDICALEAPPCGPQMHGMGWDGDGGVQDARPSAVIPWPYVLTVVMESFFHYRFYGLLLFSCIHPLPHPIHGSQCLATPENGRWLAA